MNDKENEIYMEFDAVSENERLARVVIAAFLDRKSTRLNSSH